MLRAHLLVIMTRTLSLSFFETVFGQKTLFTVSRLQRTCNSEEKVIKLADKILSPCTGMKTKTLGKRQKPVKKILKGLAKNVIFKESYQKTSRIIAHLGHHTVQSLVFLVHWSDFPQVLCNILSRKHSASLLGPGRRGIVSFGRSTEIS